MLSRRLLLSRPSRPLTSLLRTPTPLTYRPQIRCLSQADIEDPNMNGGYINPPAIPRQFRDPYADWWDKQEMRNYGEPVHEDNDILGVFSPHEYTHYKPLFGFFLLSCFVATFMGVVGVVSMYYPDKPSVHRGFEGGLDKELGGEGAVPVSETHRGDEGGKGGQVLMVLIDVIGTDGRWYRLKDGALRLCSRAFGGPGHRKYALSVKTEKNESLFVTSRLNSSREGLTPNNIECLRLCYATLIQTKIDRLLLKNARDHEDSCISLRTSAAWESIQAPAKKDPSTLNHHLASTPR